MKGRITAAGPDVRFVLHQDGLDCPLGEIILPPGRQLAPSASELLLCIRPEHVRITPAQDARLAATVDLVEPTGPEDIVTLRIGNHPAVVRRPAGDVAQGSTVGVVLDAGEAMLFEPVSGQRLL